jgi:exosortase
MTRNSPKIWSERWRLAALEKPDLIRIALLSVVIGLVFALFHYQGNTTDLRVYGRSVFAWTVIRWSESGEDYSHAWLVPWVSLGLLWFRRHEIMDARKKSDVRGLWVVIFALLLHWLGAKAQQSRISLAGFILLLWGVPFYLWGWEVARYLIFPCAYLVFAIPLTFLDSMTFPLRLVVAKSATFLLNGLGVPANRSGSAIYSLAAGGFNFDVADPCSGLRSLLAMTALMAVYAYLTQRTLLRKWLLFLCSVPIAVLGNIVRILTIALVAQAFGQEIATGLYHDYSGYVFFAAAISLMVGVGSLLSIDFRKWKEQWKQRLLSPISLPSAS